MWRSTKASGQVGAEGYIDIADLKQLAKFIWGLCS